jgi:hypothetical protein
MGVAYRPLTFRPVRARLGLRLSGSVAQALSRGLLGRRVSDGNGVGSTFIASMNYDRGSSTILHVVVVVQPQLKVLYMLAMHPSSEDVEHASGSSSKDGDVLGHADNWG